MPKSSTHQIELDEIKVIEELQKNSKESIDNIAKKCGFSRQKVWRIIKRLEKNDTIWGYHAVISEDRRPTFLPRLFKNIRVKIVSRAK